MPARQPPPGAWRGGGYPHRDPRHPNAEYRRRKLATATNRGVDRFNGEVQTIDEGWDYFWPNPDGTVADIDRKICQFLAPRAS
jgi:hypothetical protein